MAASLSERLARHRARRRQGQPIVSAWSSAWPFDAEAVGTALGGTVVTSAATTLEDARLDWLFQWLGENRLQSILSARLNLHLAEALGVSPDRAMTVLSETSAQDREPVIAQAEARLPNARLARLLRWWVQHTQRSGRDAILALDRSLAEIDPQVELRTLTSMAEVCPPEDRPWLAAIPPDPLPEDPIAWLAAAGERMTTVTSALPDWPALVAAPESMWRAASADMSKAPKPVVRLLAGLLEPLGNETDDHSGDVVAFYDLDTSLRSLLRGQGTTNDLSADLVDSHPESPRSPPEAPKTEAPKTEAPKTEGLSALRSTPSPLDRPNADRGPVSSRDRTVEPPAPAEQPVPGPRPLSPRTPPPSAGPVESKPETPASPSERTRGLSAPSGPQRPASPLLARLEADPTTAGLFVLDARLDGGPAGRRVEVALYGAELALAIEIDSEFAYPNVEAYRRERTKDLWLQRRGILIMRILAQDLEKRLEDIVLQVRDVVRERRIRGKRR